MVTLHKLWAADNDAGSLITITIDNYKIVEDFEHNFKSYLAGNGEFCWVQLRMLHPILAGDRIFRVHFIQFKCSREGEKWQSSG